jgi:hypothetical protein
MHPIHALPEDERRQLINTIIMTFGGRAGQAQSDSRRSLRELRGRSREIWEGVDAQDYVSRLRDEWDERSCESALLCQV